MVGKALETQPISREEARWVLSFPEERVVELVGEVGRVRRGFFGDRVKLNTLVSMKSGLCPEDCGYCSQSKVSAAAEKAREAGAKRLCLVASGRGPTSKELERFAGSVRAEVNLRSLQPLGPHLANSIFAGDYLTNEGQPASSDLKMIEDAGFVVETADEATLPRDRGETSGEDSAVPRQYPQHAGCVTLKSRQG